MPHRWYDCDPTLSMAVSLLQSVGSQQQTAVVTDGLAEVLTSYPHLKNDDVAGDGLLFFWKRRQGWTADMWRLLALIEQLPRHERHEMALWLLDRLVHSDRNSTTDSNQALQAN